MSTAIEPLRNSTCCKGSPWKQASLAVRVTPSRRPRSNDQLEPFRASSRLPMLSHWLRIHRRRAPASTLRTGSAMGQQRLTPLSHLAGLIDMGEMAAGGEGLHRLIQQGLKRLLLRSTQNPIVVTPDHVQ